MSNNRIKELQELLISKDGAIDQEKVIEFTEASNSCWADTYAIPSEPIFGRNIFIGLTFDAIKWTGKPPLLFTRNRHLVSAILSNCNKPYKRYETIVSTVNKLFKNQTFEMTRTYIVSMPIEIINMFTDYLYKPLAVPKWCMYTHKYYCLKFLIFTDYKQAVNKYLLKDAVSVSDEIEYKGGVICAACALKGKTGSKMYNLLLWSIWDVLIHLDDNDHQNSIIQIPSYDMKEHIKSYEQLKAQMQANYMP